jgi:hypothetical protein
MIYLAKKTIARLLHRAGDILFKRSDYVIRPSVRAA